jgi:hypothetical protein
MRRQDDEGTENIRTNIQTNESREKVYKNEGREE